MKKLSILFLVIITFVSALQASQYFYSGSSTQANGYRAPLLRKSFTVIESNLYKDKVCTLSSQNMAVALLEWVDEISTNQNYDMEKYQKIKTHNDKDTFIEKATRLTVGEDKRKSIGLSLFLIQ